MNGEDTSLAAVITELAVGKTGENLAAVAAEEFESEEVVIVERRSDHAAGD